VATVVVAKWCKQLDEDTLQRELGNGPTPVSAPQATRSLA
jgi:aerobic C4-dicarboxylate transport protein